MADIRTILVLEDDETVLSVTATMLESLGYRPLRAKNVGDARAVLARERVDLVLSDVVLADDTNGPEFAGEIRLRHPGMPVVFMTGNPAAASRRVAEFDAEIRLLNKPFRVSQLDAALRDALR